MGMNTDAVQRLYVAYFNRPADPASLAVYEAMLPSDREATQAELEALAETYFSPSQEYADLYSGMSNAQIVNQMYQNLFGRDAEPAGLLHWTGKLIDGSESFASIALQLTYSAQGSDAAAIDAKISAATAFTTEVASSTDNIVGYSGNAAAASARTWLATVTDEATASVAITNVVGAVSDAVNATDAVSGQTYQLQVGQDVITAGNGGDTFDGVANSNNGALATLTTIDRIDGGGGSDTVILNSGALTDLTLSALTSIEKIVTNAGTTLGANAQAAGVVEVETSGTGGLTLASGYTNDAVTFTALAAQTDQVDFQNLTAGTNVRVTLDPSAVGNNSIGMFDVQTEDTAGALTGGISKFDDEGTILRSTTDATVVFDVRDTAGNSLGNYREVHLGTVAADTVTAGAGISVYAAGGTGNDQLTGSTAADYLDGGAGNDAITANAGNNNAAGGAGNDTISATTGTDTLDGGAGNDQIDGGAGNDQLAGGDGNDSITIGTGTDNASGGEGNDTIVAGANLGNDTIAGGNGNDVMTVNALGTGGDALFANTTSVETLTLATGSSTIGSAAQAAGVTTVNLDTAGANNDVLAATGFSTGLTVNIGTGNDNIGLGSGGDTLVAGTGELTTNDTVAFNAGNDTVSASGSNTLDLDDITGLESVVVTGTTGNDTAAVEFDTITATTVQTITVDASALNGASDTLALTQGGGGGGTRFDVTGAAGNDTLTTNANADTIDGGAGNDSITSGNGANQVVGGAGNDNIVLGTGNDDAQGGTGNDSITSGTGNDTINGGAGSDTITMGANFTFDDQIDGGADTDTLSVTTLTTDGDIKFLQTSNIEAVTLTAAGSNTIGARAQSSGVTTVTMSGAGAETLTATAYTTGLTVNMGATNGDRVATGTGNDSVVGSATTTFDPTDTITLGTGNDTISVAGAANSLDLDNVTGLESIVFVNTTAADTMRLDLSAITTSTDSSVTIDGSALTTTGDNIDLNNGGGGTTSYVITGSVGNDNLEGGAVADTISGGSAGNDTVTTNAGNDSVTTAGGNDSVSGNTGNNHIVTGAGTDTITATTGNDTIDAGAGNDAITGGTGMDKLTGGAGADTFTVGTEASTFIYDTITDFATGVGGDTISGLHTGASTAAETFNSTAISLGSNATFQDYLDEGAKTTGTEGEISWFQFNGNTYLVQDNNAATTFVAGSDIVVEITGLVDLSGGTPGDGSFGP
jgi:Ca2+-binding RTX toxin-like protein